MEENKQQESNKQVGGTQPAPAQQQQQGQQNQQHRSRKRQARKDERRRNTLVIDSNEVELSERVVKMARVAKVVKGGRRFSFNALTAIGDSDQYVGLGFGKAKEVPEAIRKSIEDGKKNVIKVKKQGNTIPHMVMGCYKSAKVMLKPAAPGTGIIAGAAVRAVIELGGVKDILTKARGSSNSLNIAKATIDGLKQLSSASDAKKRRQLTLSEVFGDYAKNRRNEKREALGIKVASTKTEEASSQEAGEES